MNTILTDLAGYRDPDALTQSTATVDAMRTNPYFPTPDEPYADVDAAILNFKNMLSKCVKGTPVDTANKDAARLIVDIMYRNQGFYVIRICNGNIAMLRSSKYVIRQPKPSPSSPDFEVTNSNIPGKVLFAVKSIAGYRSFVIECRIVSDTAPNAWLNCKTIGSCSDSQDGFTSGLEYEFRVKAIFRKSEGAWLESVILRIM